MIAFTGGGTGGHLAIVDAVKEHIDTPKIYIGSTRGLDKKWFENDKSFEAKYFLESQSVVDKGKLGRIITMGKIFKEALRARALLKQHNTKVVFSVGGYSAAPTAFAALSLRIPLVIHEQNAHMGSLNKLLKPFAKDVISPYDNGTLKIAAPVKEIFFQTQRVRNKIKTILISGGSQGSLFLNNFALKLAPILKEKNIEIYHQAGIKHEQKVKKEYEKLGIKANVFGFSKELPSIINKADFAIARAGSSTLWEFVANGLPALFVPYPYAAGDHQYYNAKYLSDKNLAWVKRENELDIEFAKSLLDKDLTQISKQLPQEINKDGAKKIAQYLSDFVINI
jgi:UDP-N-acetylglucosamine--N-acetylmuramyl-(pentapeptide) pyrophosphoryl-undecaprenol N-acetylglucosamine transferase